MNADLSTQHLFVPIREKVLLNAISTERKANFPIVRHVRSLLLKILFCEGFYAKVLEIAFLIRANAFVESYLWEKEHGKMSGQ